GEHVDRVDAAALTAEPVDRALRPPCGEVTVDAGVRPRITSWPVPLAHSFPRTAEMSETTVRIDGGEPCIVDGYAVDQH
ncbi:hypothetical protein DR093_03250, partial [Mycoplasma flocculare]|nr:hypothetical protein [Mesomycoplasma flocculare]